MWTVVGDMDEDPPLTAPPVRFAIGVPGGRSSHRWTLHRSHNDVYFGCPEVPEAKLSLHASGICRVAFAQDVIDAGEAPVVPGGDRAFHKWRFDRLPGEAYRVLLPASAVAVEPSARPAAKWRHVIFVRPPDGTKVVIASLWISSQRGEAHPPSDTPYLWLASVPLPNGRWIELVLTAVESGWPLECLRRDMSTVLAAAAGDVDEMRTCHAFQVGPDGVPYVAVYTPGLMRPEAEVDSLGDGSNVVDLV